MVDRLKNNWKDWLLGSLIALTAWSGQTAESRLHERLNALESDRDRLVRVEAKLDALTDVVKQMNRRIP